MPNQTGPRTAKGKAVTRYNAATHGIYSVTPVVPAFERERDWQAHRARVFEDLQPDGYMQEIIAERIAVKTWRLRRLVRYEREQIRNRQRNIPEHLAVSSFLAGRKVRDDEEASIKLIDRWAMDALIPNEKELAILMRWEGRLTRELRLDMLHLEQMQRQRRDHRRLLSFGQPESNPLPAPSGGLAPGGGHEGARVPAEEPESQPPRAFAERNPMDSPERPAQRESLGDPVALRLS